MNVAAEGAFEALRRKFLKQNREIVKVNIAHASRIKRLEEELQTMQFENISLHHENIKLRNLFKTVKDKIFTEVDILKDVVENAEQARDSIRKDIAIQSRKDINELATNALQTELSLPESASASSKSMDLVDVTDNTSHLDIDDRSEVSAQALSAELPSNISNERRIGVADYNVFKDDTNTSRPEEGLIENAQNHFKSIINKDHELSSCENDENSFTSNMESNVVKRPSKASHLVLSSQSPNIPKSPRLLTKKPSSTRLSPARTSLRKRDPNVNYALPKLNTKLRNNEYRTAIHKKKRNPRNSYSKPRKSVSDTTIDNLESIHA